MMATGNGRQDYMPRRGTQILILSAWNSLLITLHETLNESGWIDLVHDATKGKENYGHESDFSETNPETARDGKKNFDQIYTYIQEVAKSTLALP
jgi:hypothetical protein